MNTKIASQMYLNHWTIKSSLQTNKQLLYLKNKPKRQNQQKVSK